MKWHKRDKMKIVYLFIGCVHFSLRQWVCVCVRVSLIVYHGHSVWNNFLIFCVQSVCTLITRQLMSLCCALHRVIDAAKRDAKKKTRKTKLIKWNLCLLRAVAVCMRASFAIFFSPLDVITTTPLAAHSMNVERTKNRTDLYGFACKPMAAWLPSIHTNENT